MLKIGVCDTTFARANMAKWVLEEITDKAKIVRYTVPGIKDLPVACLKLFKEDKCDLVIALGMPGGAPIDTQCAHEASLGIQAVQLQTAKHVLEVFVHEGESKDERELLKICVNRARKHARNALKLLEGKTALTLLAGQGLRQGREDAGKLRC